MKESKILNHMNFSGMNLSEDYLRIILKCLSKSRLIMGIHLNDNGITKNNQLMLELMDILGLNIEDLPLSKNEYADF